MATVKANFPVEMDPYVIVEATVSALTDGVLETLTPDGALIATGKAIVPADVRFMITTPPTSRCPVNMSCESKSSTTGAITYRFWGGDLTDMVVQLIVVYRAFKTGGLAGA